MFLLLTRSGWKLVFVDKSILRFIRKINAGVTAYSFEIRSRRSCITPIFHHKRICVYNGRKFVGTRHFLDSLNVGDKFGEYALSKKRTRLIHIFNKAQRKKKKLKALAAAGNISQNKSDAGKKN